MAHQHITTIFVVCCIILPALCSALPLIKPMRLKAGDTVAFISPASPIINEVGNITKYKMDVQRGMAALGLKVEFSPYSFESGPGGLAGTDQQRASDIMWAFLSPHIKGIIANRGGWGCNRIIDMLDYSVIAAHPKILMGFSDLTGCINAINTKTGLGTFHGPMGLSAWDGTLNAQYMNEVLIKATPNLLLQSKTSTKTIVGGIGRGRLLGGNLSVFNALLGSPYLPLFDEPYVLFFEDVGEKSYSIDRMMTTLHLAGAFKNAQALVWGQCTNCPAGGDFTVDEIIMQKWGNLLNVPSFSGAMIGHIHEQFTVPIGGQVEVDANRGTIRLLGSSVL